MQETITITKTQTIKRDALIDLLVNHSEYNTHEIINDLCELVATDKLYEIVEAYELEAEDY